jgi:predicted RND superfamily exporter protein
MFNIIKINACFRRLSEGILRFRAVVVFACLLLTVVAGMGLPHLRQDTSQENWFLEGDAALETKRHFEAIFGQDDFCAVLLRADNIVTPENLTLIRELGRELALTVPYADDVLSITDSEISVGTEGGFEIISLVPPKRRTRSERYRFTRPYQGIGLVQAHVQKPSAIRGRT